MNIKSFSFYTFVKHSKHISDFFVIWGNFDKKNKYFFFHFFSKKLSI